MPDFDLFDMDFDGDVDGIDFLGFDYLMQCMLGHKEREDDEELVGDDEHTYSADEDDY